MEQTKTEGQGVDKGRTEDEEKDHDEEGGAEGAGEEAEEINVKGRGRTKRS